MGLSIGLIGVPGSGKTALAQALTRALENTDLSLQCKECLTPVAVVDDYVPSLQKRVDLQLDHRANYIGNFHVALERESLERQAALDHKTIITCGTLFETATYCAQSFEKEQEWAADDAERRDLYTRIEATFRMFGCLYIDTLKYSHMFYLPPISNFADQLMDRNLQSAFGAFQLQEVIALPANGDGTIGITASRVEKVLNNLDILEQDESDLEGSGASASKPI